MGERIGGDEPACGDRIAVRAAREDDLPAVMNVLDAAMLEVDAATVGERIGDGSGRARSEAGVLVAVEEDRVLGACLVDPSGRGVDDAAGGSAHVEAIAVRPGRRGRGVGAALIEAATERWGPLSADFDPRVRGFYESLGFEVERVGGCDAGGRDDSPNARFRGRRG